MSGKVRVLDLPPNPPPPPTPMPKPPHEPGPPPATDVLILDQLVIIARLLREIEYNTRFLR